MNNMKNLVKITLILALSTVAQIVNAQGDPTDSIPGDPGGISVETVQGLHFGAFSHGPTGGSVSINTAGVRTSMGSVTELDFGVSYFEAIFDVAAPEDATVSILNGSDATLTGSNGGSMIMSLGSASPGSPFVVTIPSPGTTEVHVGGTLTVGNSAANPPGVYSGTFYITFNLE
jgi:hypothetical protein